MRANTFKSGLVRSALAAALLLSSGLVFAQSVVTLTAAPTSAALPDGQVVPMWGYACGAVSGAGVSCLAATGLPQTGGWQPPVITAPSGSPLSITLVNSLSFPTAAAPNALPTSLVIVGQLGGGLGNAPTRTDSPPHATQGVTWPTAGAGTGAFTPPPQSQRAQSFATEVAPGSSSTLVWTATNLRPGTYLMESGTHPSIQGPMGLYGVLVITGAGYPGVSYDKDALALLSEIDPVQNRAVDLAVRTAGFSETKVWNGQSGQCGDPTSAQANTCYPPAVNYDPRYYLINGVAFDRSNASKSFIAGPAAAATALSGNVLLRYVNAGLRMHVPSVVGLSMALYAEDGNPLPGIPKIQNEVFLAAGKTYDVVVKPPVNSGTYAPGIFPIYDRQLSLSTNNQRDGGMQAYLQVAAGALPNSGTSAAARPDTYYLVPGNVLDLADPAKGVIANDVGVYGVQVQGTGPTGGSLTLNANGTFTYTPNAGTVADAFNYCGNGATSGSLCTTVTLAPCTGVCAGGKPIANADSYTSVLASTLKITSPGILANDVDPQGHPLTAVLEASCVAVPGYSCLSSGQVTVNGDGSFVAHPPAAGNYTFSYHALNSQNTASDPTSVTLTFPAPTGLVVNLKDAITGAPVTDYRWIIEEDRTYFSDPKCQINSTDTSVRPASCPPLPVQSLAYNFHTANMPVVATGCVGAVSCESGQSLLGAPAACDLGNGVCHTDVSQKVEVRPDQIALDPSKRYYLSVMPGDGINPTLAGSGVPVEDPPGSGKMRQFKPSDCTSFVPGTGDCGHAMGGAQIAAGQTTVNISLQQTPLPTAKISVFVYEDDYPLNGENDAGGGVDVIAPNEPGLGGFELKVFDQAGGLGDFTGQATYDMFNMPLSNSLAGTIDPATGQNACPITNRTDGIVGMIPTCPKFEADGVTPSPIAGQAIIANLYPGLYEIVATPAADRIGRGEEWLQTNTLDGGKAHEASIKPNEPGYFQEFGPGGFHISIGFANPKTINDRRHNTAGTGLCDPKPNGGGLTCTATLNGQVTATRMSRTPDQRIYSSGSYDAFSFTQCYVGLGAPDDPTFAFAKCNPDGTFTLTGLPIGDFALTVFDQWNDLVVDGLVSSVKVDGSTATKVFPITQWRTNMYTRTFIDQNGDGVSQDSEPGLALVPTNIRYRDGSFGFYNNTDLNGYAAFNEVFPFMNWLVVETDSTRYKPTGTHVVYDAGGPADGTTGGGNSTIAAHLANTLENVPLPDKLKVPGARYCASADCPAGDTAGGSTGRVDPPWTTTQGWQGLLGQNSFIEFGMKPFAAGENGGIRGHVIYASTRPFDDPALLVQMQWEPAVPRVTINLYQESTAPDGTKSLKLVDTTLTSSWDDWAQGVRSDGTPNMNCPGQDPNSPFFQTLQGSTQYLNPGTALPNNAQFKCFDGWAMLNQVQPAPYDGKYTFPSVTSRSPTTGLPTATNCDPAVCVNNPTGDGTKMLLNGKYVVEVVVPQGFEIVKEEDKNILLGDIFIAPVTQQFASVGNIFILPDQAAMNATYNKNNPLIPTTDLGQTPRREADTGNLEQKWPCVGDKRIVPDFMSLFPTTKQNAPFAGALRALCDRKEVVLADQASVTAKFYVFTPTQIAGHFTGTITNDYASEFDPFSPQFGEKFGPPNLPVGLRDFAGNEVSRVYADQWGVYNGLYFSSWEVNPPNPTGFAPQMAIACMNDPGPIPGPGGTMITDPNYSSAYSNFCYETPFMPGFTAYMDTPVVPTMAFADSYNLPESDYPDATPAISRVAGDVVPGPWVGATGSHLLTITALGDKPVLNPAFSGPNASTAPFNQKTILRHYGFGATPGTVSIGVDSRGRPIPATVTGWADGQITVTVPNGNSDGTNSTVANRLPLCTLQQRGVGNDGARCGELVISAANGKQSIDAVTVTVGGKSPTYVTPASPSSTTFGQNFPNPLQTAIDNATPGDLIIVGPGTYKEMLLMWKPVRLQGVGAASVTINADAHPVGKLDPWRRQVNCLFGLTLDGAQNINNASFDPAGVYTCPASMYFSADRIPFEGFVGWDASSNGNLAQLLQEPTLMGAYEGSGVTVVGRGVRIPRSSNDFWGQAAQGGQGAGTFPDGSVYLTSSTADCNASTTPGRSYGPSNFLCNPSRIDGVSVTNSSQGGGGIFMHGWGHNLEIANTRVFANQGTLSGGINVGNGETPPAYVNDGTICGPGVASPAPLCPPLARGTPTNAIIPFQLNTHVHVHHNAVTSNASLGDALFSGTPSGAGGITITAGADFYQLDHNWIAANLSVGDGGGLVHSGFSTNGTIANNWILFNQSTNPTLPTNGGGLAVIGANADVTQANGQECGTTNDTDCPPGIGDGTGPGLVIDANLIMGNSAESGSGGGVRLQGVNGSEVAAFPRTPARWNAVTLTNNVIANNVAGWDGGGVSIQDSLKVSLINNTVVSNDTTASAGALFKTIGSAFASSPPPGCNPGTDPSASCYSPDAPTANQPAGLVTMQNTPYLSSSLPATVTCPPGFGYASGNVANSCKNVSLPVLENNLFWQNRAFHIVVGGLGQGNQNQQNLVTLTPALNQTVTGECASGAVYWDIGVRGDSSASSAAIDPTIIPGGGTNPTLSLSNSILTSLSSRYTGNGNLAPSSSPVLAQYCNGSRVPPENGGHGYNAPAGRSETTGLSTVFTLNNITPAATVDEGNNWINLGYGPLALPSPAAQVMLAVASVGTTGGAYSIGSSSAAANAGNNSGAPDHDFFNNPRARTTANRVDIGAVEVPTATIAVGSVTPTSLAFGSVATGSASSAQTLTVQNNGGAAMTGVNVAVSAPFSRSGGTCGATLAANATCTINVVFSPTVAGAASGTVSLTASVAITGSPVALSGTGIAAVRSAVLAPANWTVATTRCAGFACLLKPIQAFTLTNTGNVPLTGIAQGALGGANPGSYAVTSLCGSVQNTLNPGASCTVVVQFRPATSQPTGAKPATISVTDSAGTQTSTLNGTAN